MWLAVALRGGAAVAFTATSVGVWKASRELGVGFVVAGVGALAVDLVLEIVTRKR